VSTTSRPKNPEEVECRRRGEAKEKSVRVKEDKIKKNGFKNPTGIIKSLQEQEGMYRKA